MVERGGGPLTSSTTVLCSSITTFFRLSIRLATMVFWVSQVLQFPFWIPICLCDIWREFSSSDFQPAQRLRQLKRQGHLEQWFLGYLKSCFRRQSTVGNSSEGKVRIRRINTACVSLSLTNKIYFSIKQRECQHDCQVSLGEGCHYCPRMWANACSIRSDAQGDYVRGTKN